MKLFYKFISVVLHPVFVPSYVYIILSYINSYIFGTNTTEDFIKRLFFIMLATIIIPLVSVLTLKGVGLIDSFEMENKLDRTGPFIISGIFMIWLFLNAIRGNDFPMAYTVFILGSVITLFASFFVNIFFKTSLHTAGMGGFVGGLFLFLAFFKYNGPISIALGQSNFYFTTELLFLIVIVLAGLVGASRLYLKAHDNYQLLSGYFIGFSSQIIALKVLFLIS